MGKEPEQGMLGRDGSRESCATNKAVNGCPSQLIKLAQSDFERACVQEFIEIEENMRENLAKIRVELKYLKWLIVTVLFTVIVSKIIGG